MKNTFVAFKSSKNLCISIFVAFSLIHAISGGIHEADAQNSKRQCVNNANAERDACTATCKATRADAVLTCLVPPNECGDQCKATFVSCMSPVNGARQLCTNTCDATYDASRAACANACGCTDGENCGGSACFGNCLDLPTITRAACKVACHRRRDIANARKACAKSLRSCSKICR